MNIGSYSVADFTQLARSFHGSPAPGLLIGGLMVSAALERIDKDRLHDAICETPSCLPDAVQLLTPCTVGNGWLRIVNLGRFALSLYDKETGKGVRVFLDAGKADRWPEVKSWYLKLKPKREQSLADLSAQIVEAGTDLFGFQEIEVLPEFLTRRSKGEIGICPECGEAYPTGHGSVCKGCGGESPYSGENANRTAKAVAESEHSF
jgi:formylmethanofuran dehydrogenase subunit E